MFNFKAAHISTKILKYSLPILFVLSSSNVYADHEDGRINNSGNTTAYVILKGDLGHIRYPDSHGKKIGKHTVIIENGNYFLFTLDLSGGIIKNSSGKAFIFFQKQDATYSNRQNAPCIYKFHTHAPTTGEVSWEQNSPRNCSQVTVSGNTATIKNKTKH